MPSQKKIRSLTMALTLGLALATDTMFHKCIKQGCRQIVPGPSYLCGPCYNQQQARGWPQLATDPVGRIGPDALCAAGDKCTHILNSGNREVRASWNGQAGKYCSRGCQGMNEVLDQGQNPSCAAYALAQALTIARQRDGRSAHMTQPLNVEILARELWSRSPLNPASGAMYATYADWQSGEARKYGMEVVQIDGQSACATPAGINQALQLLNTNNAGVVMMGIRCSEERFYSLFRPDAWSVSLADWAQARDDQESAAHLVLCLNQQQSGGHHPQGFMVKNSWGADMHHGGKIYVDAEVVRQNPTAFDFSVVRPISH